MDNGSSDDTMDIARSFEGVTVLEERNHLSSPYSSRNRGIEIARGNVIVFLDATCTPTKNWLQEGLKFLQEEDSDLIGGQVKFDFSGGYNAARIYDSLVNIQMKSSILDRNVAKTANLFVKREVINVIGAFPEGIRSGGDVRWTHRATSQGFKLKFAPEAVVLKNTRSYWPLLKKQWRISLAHPMVWEEDGRAKRFKFYIRDFFNLPTLRSIKKLIDERGTPEMLDHRKSTWAFALVAVLTVKTAHLLGYIKLKISRKNN